MFSQIAIDYACRDADATLRLYHVFEPRLQREGLYEAYRRTMDTMPLILAMERTGWRIDIGHMEHLLDVFDEEYQMVRDQIEDLGFPGLNPISWMQVGDALFNKLGLIPKAFTKGTKRPSTEDKHLMALLTRHPVVERICTARELVKLAAIVRDILHNTRAMGSGYGRLLPRLNMTGTPTGRLACRNPNLLAIPKHSERGKAIRKGFLPPEGTELWSWDLSQAELRVLALESKDPALVSAFTEGRDIHTETAARMFKRTPSESDRFAAKAVNFGIPMGMSSKGLTEQMHKGGLLGHTSRDSKEWLRSWHEDAYPTASRWLDDQVAACRRHGYVSSLGGRRRYLPGVGACSGTVKGRAIRQCQSFPLQAGAQDLMHLWEARVYREVVEPGAARAILQIHDDLVMAGPPETYAEVDALMKSRLPQGYLVPIVADGQRGDTWGDLKESQ